MQSRVQSYLVICVLLFAVIVILVWNAVEREEELREHRQLIQSAIVDNASDSISTLIRDQQERLHIFAEEYASTLSSLALGPDQEALRAGLESRMRKRFPMYMTLTIATSRGEPLLEDIESFVGEMCKIDLQQYSMDTRNLGLDQRNRVYIHPRAEHYHYDIMTLWKDVSGSDGIFFVSFEPQKIAKILHQLEIPGLTLLVVKRSVPTLIEIGAGGARDKLQRTVNLSDSEYRQVSVTRDIKGTDWRLLAVRDAPFVAAREAKIWRQAYMILGVVVLATLLMMLIVWRTGRYHAPK